MNNTLTERFINDRKELHTKLVNALGNNNVYFQPPETIKLKYPCIIYTMNGIDSTHADNVPYNHEFSYTITLIGTDPMSSVIIKLLKFPRCEHNNKFCSDGLYHDVFKIKI